MKRTVCLLLCVLMICPLFTACTKELQGDGAIFNAYIASETFCFDPTFASVDDDSTAFLSLIFEGLTKIDANGKLQNALLDHYKYTQDKLRDEYKLTLYMKQTKWSDAAAVTADDFLFSWKRLLSSDVSASAAALLYDVKNARAAKNGECSIDDVGIASVDTYTLEVTFEHEIDVEAFLYKCASIQLVPLRENVVSRNALATENWAKRFATLSVNGPFCVRGLDYSANTVSLQRNNFYYRVDDSALNEYVEPYKITINFVKNNDNEAEGEDLQAQLDKYLAGESLILGDLPLDKRAEYASQGTVMDTLSTMSVLVNSNNPLFANKQARVALSLAVDRAALADKVVFAKPATGLINELVHDTSSKTSFRSAVGSLISTSADASGAKSALSAAGVNGGSFKLTYKNTEEFAAVAEYLKSAWDALGFTVELNPVMSEEYRRTIDDQDLTLYNDVLFNTVNNGDYDVVLFDFSMISTDPFGVLAQFAYGFTGNNCDVEKDWAITAHSSGFNSEEYNTSIETAFAEKDYAKRVELLHASEKLLLEEMPIIPLLFNQSFFMYSSELDDISFNYFGNAQLKSVYYASYTTEAEEDNIIPSN